MNKRPWQIATLILIISTLLLWSEVRVEVNFGQFEASQSNLPDRQSLVEAVSAISSQVAVNATASAVPTQQGSSGVAPAIDAKRVDYKPAVNVFPTVDKSKNPVTDIITILESGEAKAVQDQQIPKEGTKSPAGYEFSLDSFTAQKEWSKSIAVDPTWKDRYEKITTSIYHPCCGVTISTNDCGHAIAGTGLVKKMLQDGKSDAEIYTEQLAWQKYYFPRHYVIMALALKKAGESADKVDLSPDYSTVQSEKYASDYLIY